MALILAYPRAMVPQQRALYLELGKYFLYGLPFLAGFTVSLANNFFPGIVVCPLIGGLIIARPLAAIFADSIEGLFHTREAITEIPPIYSIAEARIQEGNFDAARERYDEMMDTHPHLLKVYVDAFKLAARYMEDLEYFETIRERGLAQLNERDHAALEAIHTGFIEYFAQTPAWRKQSPIAYKPGT